MAKKILIIEDEVALLEVMRAKLTHSGYVVESAEDGEKGLGLIHSSKPDLILLDIVLPKMDGIQILEALQKEGNKIPIVIVSNSGQPVEIDQLLKLGARDYLVKANFTPQEVLNKVQSVFGDTMTVSPNEAVASRARKIPASKNTAGTDVMLIEDDRFLQDLLSKKLTLEGFSVRSAYDGEDGLRLSKELQPRIILLDIILPGIDGFEFLSLAKKEAEIKNIQIIVLSNLGQREEINRAMDLGADDYLIKANFAPDEILNKVRSVLAKFEESTKAA